MTAAEIKARGDVVPAKSAPEPIAEIVPDEPMVVDIVPIVPATPVVKRGRPSKKPATVYAPHRQRITRGVRATRYRNSLALATVPVVPPPVSVDTVVAVPEVQPTTEPVFVSTGNSDLSLHDGSFLDTISLAPNAHKEVQSVEPHPENSLFHLLQPSFGDSSFGQIQSCSSHAYVPVNSPVSQNYNDLLEQLSDANYQDPLINYPLGFDTEQELYNSFFMH